MSDTMSTLTVPSPHSDQVVFQLPNTYEIKISNTFTVCCTGAPPNRFHRAMLRLLLGWKVVVY